MDAFKYIFYPTYPLIIPTYRGGSYRIWQQKHPNSALRNGTCTPELEHLDSCPSSGTPRWEWCCRGVCRNPPGQAVQPPIPKDGFFCHYQYSVTVICYDSMMMFVFIKLLAGKTPFIGHNPKKPFGWTNPVSPWLQVTRDVTWLYPLVINRGNGKSLQNEGLIGKIIYDWMVFQCHVWFPEGV